jgi:hypothetical protein
MTTYEKETIINFNEEEPTARIYTCNCKMKRQLNKLADCDIKFSDQTVNEPVCKKYIDQQFHGEGFIIPKEWIKIVPPRKISSKRKKELKDHATRIRNK